MSVDVDGKPTTRFSGNPALSADGRFVAYNSDDENLVPGPHRNPNLTDVYVRDRLTRTTERVSVATADMQDQDRDFSVDPSISPSHGTTSGVA